MHSHSHKKLRPKRLPPVQSAFHLAPPRGNECYQQLVCPSETHDVCTSKYISLFITPTIKKTFT